MVDRTALIILGSIVLAAGIMLTALSGRLARSQAVYFHGLSGRKRLLYWLFGIGGTERSLKARTLFTGLLMILIGSMWIAGIGSK